VLFRYLNIIALLSALYFTLTGIIEAVLTDLALPFFGMNFLAPNTVRLFRGKKNKTAAIKTV